MVIGGLMTEAFKLFLGNPDVMASLITFMVFSALMLTIIEVNNDTKT